MDGMALPCGTHPAVPLCAPCCAAARLLRTQPAPCPRGRGVVGVPARGAPPPPACRGAGCQLQQVRTGSTATCMHAAVLLAVQCTARCFSMLLDALMHGTLTSAKRMHCAAHGITSPALAAPPQVWLAVRCQLPGSPVSLLRFGQGGRGSQAAPAVMANHGTPPSVVNVLPDRSLNPSLAATV